MPSIQNKIISISACKRRDLYFSSLCAQITLEICLSKINLVLQGRLLLGSQMNQATQMELGLDKYSSRLQDQIGTAGN